MSHKVFDVIIVGGGPSGASCAIKLADANLKVALLEKALFPRDKTCGDALSVDVVNQVKILSPVLEQQFAEMSNKIASYGVKIVAPNQKHVDIPFIHKGNKSFGYISPRLDFDNLLFQHAKALPTIDTFENCTVTKVATNSSGVTVDTNLGSFSAKLVIGADGAHSVVQKHLGDIQVEKDHYCAGLRVYYENVASFHEENFIELHYFNEILPGYLWVFPLAGNKANVGIGVLSSVVSKHKLNLKDVLQKLINNHPHLKERFKDARPLETVKGYGLPLGSKKRNISGERFLLTGDAAALIDPFTGEGIANAIRSGRVAADHAIRCFEQQQFSAAFNKAYDKEIYRRMWGELKISRLLQQLVRYPWAFNFAVKRAQESKYIQQFLIDALSNIEKKKKILFKPGFYLSMLFR
ncbi:geranylgeranyl reductase family protein [Aridibaculum aurantiacum]|uniref:geranylgeranyl reductase family protein n=1 Tax=Aridibaculum aurantiacum TaxID=2810307 RepID=UPI001A977BD3|nr:geranylgeranyl reductase family protein [Aridibaculum aurantiacum]